MTKLRRPEGDKLYLLPVQGSETQWFTSAIAKSDPLVLG
jgi:hypothetical protein